MQDRFRWCVKVYSGVQSGGDRNLWGQARDRYPITLIHVGDEAETLTAMRPAALRAGDVICIADECFLFERIALPVGLQGPQPC